MLFRLQALCCAVLCCAFPCPAVLCRDVRQLIFLPKCCLTPSQDLAVSAAQQEAERAAADAAAKQDLLDTVNAELPLIRQQASRGYTVAACAGR